MHTRQHHCSHIKYTRIMWFAHTYRQSGYQSDYLLTFNGPCRKKKLHQFVVDSKQKCFINKIKSSNLTSPNRFKRMSLSCGRRTWYEQQIKISKCTTAMNKHTQCTHTHIQGALFVGRTSPSPQMTMCLIALSPSVFRLFEWLRAHIANPSTQMNSFVCHPHNNNVYVYA